MKHRILPHLIAFALLVLALPLRAQEPLVVRPWLTLEMGERSMLGLGNDTLYGGGEGRLLYADRDRFTERYTLGEIGQTFEWHPIASMNREEILALAQRYLRSHGELPHGTVPLRETLPYATGLVYRNGKLYSLTQFVWLSRTPKNRLVQCLVQGKPEWSWLVTMRERTVADADDEPFEIGHAGEMILTAPESPAALLFCDRVKGPLLRMVCGTPKPTPAEQATQALRTPSVLAFEQRFGPDSLEVEIMRGVERELQAVEKVHGADSSWAQSIRRRRERIEKDEEVRKEFVESLRERSRKQGPAKVDAPVTVACPWEPGEAIDAVHMVQEGYVLIGQRRTRAAHVTREGKVLREFGPTEQHPEGYRFLGAWGEWIVAGLKDDSEQGVLLDLKGNILAHLPVGINGGNAEGCRKAIFLDGQRLVLVHRNALRFYRIERAGRE